MRTSTSEDRDFLDNVLGLNLLLDAIDYIKDKYSAEEIYGKDILEDWALDNGFINESKAEELEQKIYDLEAENETLQRELNDYNG